MKNVLPADARHFQGQRAGFVSRLLADGIDLVVVIGLTVGLALGWSFLTSLGDKQLSGSLPDASVTFVILQVISLIYLWLGWSTTGRSIGKEVMGLRVVNHRGNVMRGGPAFLRSAFYVLFPLELLWSIVSRRNSSVQDIVLRTSVIHDWSVKTPPRAQRDASRDSAPA